MTGQPSTSRTPAILLGIVLSGLVWSRIRPHDYFTWILEVFPAVIGLIVLVAVYPRFRFTPLAYTLIALHMIVLLIGGHYTYAEVPAFNWVRDHFGLARNNYDRVGHFMQGFAPALVAREVLLRKSPLRPGRWLFFLTLCFCLALSAAYELLEWGVAEATGSAATAFLGTQGDPWDTQWDMFTALIGALISLLSLARWHDRLLANVECGVRSAE